jgi:hypothetical protein
MTEWKLFDGDTAEVSTAEFHRDRDRAPHLEQVMHRPRLEASAKLVVTSTKLGSTSVSDLGCGDGGLLSLLPTAVNAWGYDFTPANAAGWAERGVTGALLDVFDADRDRVHFGDTTVVTEVLEHLTDPHGAVRWIGEHSRFIVASSPWDEGPWGADPCHAWAFDIDGYRELLEQGGYDVLFHLKVGRFQVALGMQL